MAVIKNTCVFLLFSAVDIQLYFFRMYPIEKKGKNKNALLIENNKSICIYLRNNDINIVMLLNITYVCIVLLLVRREKLCIIFTENSDGKNHKGITIIVENSVSRPIPNIIPIIGLKIAF